MLSVIAAETFSRQHQSQTIAELLRAENDTKTNTIMASNGSAHSWQSLPNAMSKSVQSLKKRLDADKQWQAFVDTNAIVEPVTMGVASAGGEAILVKVESNSKTSVSTGSADKADFTRKPSPMDTGPVVLTQELCQSVKIHELTVAQLQRIQNSGKSSSMPIRKLRILRSSGCRA